MAILSVDIKKPGDLIIEHAGNTYALGEGGVLSKFENNKWGVVEAAENATAVEQDLLKALKKDVAHTVLSEIETNGKGLKDEVKELVRANVKAGGLAALGADAEALKPIVKSVNAAEAIVAQGATPKQIGKNLIASPKAEELLTVAENKALLDGGFSWKRLEAYKTANTELKTLVSPATADVKKIREFYIRNYANIEHLDIAAGDMVELRKAGIDFDLAKMKAEIGTEVNKAAAAAKTEAANIIRYAEDVERYGKIKGDSAKKSLEAAKENFNKAKEAYSKVIGAEFGSPVAEIIKADSKLAQGLEKHAADIFNQTLATSKTVSTAAKDGGLFTKAAKELTEFKPEQLKGLRGFWNKRNLAGKGGIIAGAGAVTYAIVSAVAGNSGPKDRAAETARSQTQTQGAALGA